MVRISQADLPMLSLGPDVIRHLIPHRRPFLFVDRVVGFRSGGQPALRAQRFISANEPVFAGHFPDLHLWPGVLTIEGLAQCCALLFALLGLQAQGEERGLSDEQVLEVLRSMERRAKRMERVEPPPELAALASGDHGIAVGARVDVKLLRPVHGGARLDYLVEHTHKVDALHRFAVAAEVDGELVAEGVLVGGDPSGAP
jgi:3-hydroxymyristoyl/3-hydroxydecanoyl-(acyl carrier protein) dehydratase